MKYKLKELMDIEKVQQILESFNNIVSVPQGIYDLEGVLLAGYRLQDVCTEFDRANKKILSRYSKSGSSLKEEKQTCICKCLSGLIKVKIPIFLENEHAGDFVIGEFFSEEPNIDYFIKQAEKLDIDRVEYIQKIKKVPIISEERFTDILNYITCLSAFFEKMVIDKRKEIEKVKCELEKSQQKYKMLLDMVPDSVFVRSKEIILYCNKAALKQLGVNDSKEVIGKNIKKFIKSKYKNNCNFEKNLDISIKQDGFSLNEEIVIRKSDNKVLYLETLGAKVHNDKLNETIVVSRDISDRKKAENLNKEVKEKEKQLIENKEYENIRTEFFANLSHEFRTPLNIILTALKMYEITYTNVIGESSFDKMYKYHFLIKQNTYRLIRLVNNLIDVIKIDAGYFQLSLKNVDIVNIVENITLSIVEYAKSKNIDVVFDTNVEEKIVGCDEEKIERIMLNLLSNAIKFTEAYGSIYVNLNCDRKYINVSVRDTGVGIPREKINLIFKKFVQVDKSLSRLNEGSGIGLSLIKSLVEMHKGKIRVQSKLGKGSCFYFTIPNKRVQNENYMESRNLSDKNLAEKIKVEFSDVYYE